MSQIKCNIYFSKKEFVWWAAVVLFLYNGNRNFEVLGAAGAGEGIRTTWYPLTSINPARRWRLPEFSEAARARYSRGTDQAPRGTQVLADTMTAGGESISHSMVT